MKHLSNLGGNISTEIPLVVVSENGKIVYLINIFILFLKKYNYNSIIVKAFCLRELEPRNKYNKYIKVK